MREIDVVAAALGIRPPSRFHLCLRVDDRQRVFERSHHAEAEQVHFHDAEIGAVVFVPLHDDAAGHRRGLERDNLI